MSDIAFRCRRTLAQVTALLVLGTLLAAAAPARAETVVLPQQWMLDSQHLDAAAVWRLATGAGITVAVIDSGVQPNQPDLRGSLVAGVNLTRAPATANTGDVSSQGHGTGVASLIAGHGHPDPEAPGGRDGVMGLAPRARIMPIVVGNGHDDDNDVIAAGIRWAVDHGARVLNVSLGGTASSPRLTQAVSYAEAHGVVVVAAAGNSAGDGDPAEYPAALPGVVAVAATTRDGGIWHESEYGGQITLAAPGVSLLAASKLPGGYGLGTGTSFAAPLVAAEAALIESVHRGWSAGQVIRDMISTARPPSGTSGHSTRFGYGAIDPLRALQAAAPTLTSNPLVTVSPRPARHPSRQAAPEGGTDRERTSLLDTLVAVVLLMIAALIVVAIIMRLRVERPRGQPSTRPEQASPTDVDRV